MLLHVTFLLLLAAPLVAGSCKGCVCKDDSHVFCQSTGITEIPGELDEDMKHLVITGNSISKLSANAFERYTNLETLDLRGNNIKEIENNAFKGLEKLVSLDLSNNDIEEVSRDTFTYFTGLKTLNLSRNALTNIPDATFSDIHMGHLETIDLCNNRIAEADIQGMFSFTMLSLRYLKLCRNGITTVTHFEKTPKLQVLDMSGNKITKSDVKKPFKDLADLESLDLSNNQLEELEDGFFKGLRKLRNLSIAANQFEQWPKEAMQEWDISDLEYVDMSGNHLVKIDNKTFGDFDVVTLVITSMPRLTAIGEHAFAGMEGRLKKLVISSNHRLTTIAPRAFDGLAGLKELILEDNGLTTLDLPSIDLTHIETLSFDRNEWQCDCKLRWMKEAGVDADFRCHGPSRMKGKKFSDIRKDHLLCSAQHSRRIVAVVSGVFGVLAIVALIIIVWRYRKNIRRWRFFRGDRYATLATYDREDGVTTNVVMNASNEKATLRDATDV